MGHVFRCVALAQMLQSKYHVVFLIRADATVEEAIRREGFEYRIISSEHPSDEAQEIRSILPTNSTFILDGYAFDAAYQQSIIDHLSTLIYIDDLCAGEQMADIIINHAPGIHANAYQIRPYSQLLTGLPYALLRKEFLEERVLKNTDHRKSVLLSLGAADERNHSARMLRMIQSEYPDLVITVLTSSANKHLDQLREEEQKKPNLLRLLVNGTAEDVAQSMLSSSAIICTASSISIEACAARIPMICGMSAQNQLGIYNGLVSAHACIGIGNLDTLEQNVFSAALSDVLQRAELRDDMIRNQAILLDKKSNLRIAEAIDTAQKHAESTWWRLARKQDMQLFYAWTNDPDVRANSFQSEPIPLESHLSWFERMMNDAHAALYVFFCGREAVGQLRLQMNNKRCTISYSVAKEARGRGYGKWILEQSEALAKQKWNAVDELAGHVTPSNEASNRVFKALGFETEHLSSEEIIYRRFIA